MVDKFSDLETANARSRARKMERGVCMSAYKGCTKVRVEGKLSCQFCIGRQGEYYNQRKTGREI